MESVIDGLVFENPVFSGATKVPGYRVILNKFVMLFANLDRLSLFIYHNREYSNTSMILFKKINEMKAE